MSLMLLEFLSLFIYLISVLFAFGIPHLGGAEMGKVLGVSSIWPVEHKVLRIVDGDTFTIRYGNKNTNVRIAGVNAPESVSTLKAPECGGDLATKYLTYLILGRDVRLEFDKTRRDRFGRLLAYVYVDYFGKDVFVNRRLLQKGLAKFYVDKVNFKYADIFEQDYLKAQSKYLGLWGVCGSNEFDGKCVIKGNITRDGDKFYHLPGDKYYDETVVNPQREDLWLCSVLEAEEKGFIRTGK